MAHHLIASNGTIKAVKPGEARQRLTDGAGPCLRLLVKGGSHGWRFDYSLNGRRNTWSLGKYPQTGLSLARKKANRPASWRMQAPIPAMCARKPATPWRCIAQRPSGYGRFTAARLIRSGRS
jgi:hypothetical protein